MQELIGSESWLETVRQGDFRAFAPVIRQYQRPVFAYIRKMTGNRHMAEDITHDAFVRAFQRIGSFQPGRDLSRWLFAIAHNLTVDHLRRRRDQLGCDELIDRTAAVEPLSAEERLDRAQIRRRIQQSLDAMAAPTRAVMVLHYLEGKAVKEIAGIMSAPIGTVLARLSRGRKQLKVLLGEIT